MPYTFKLHSESLKRRFSVYVVVAKSRHDTKLYVGKTGDNNDGCNPIISRCGNHFSYNEIHSQVRNKIEDHEDREYTYVFDHFDEYQSSEIERSISIDRINEMERWLNYEIQNVIKDMKKTKLLNPLKGTYYLKACESQKREKFRTAECEKKIIDIVTSVQAICCE
jgi:hypothetical protein